MKQLVSVFQLEVRFDHILNFSQIARKVLSPFVRLSQSIKIERENTVEERIILNFEDDDYAIIVGWDRILIRGQKSFKPYISSNSPFQMPFMAILEKLKELDEFGSIRAVLFAANYIRELDIAEDNLLSKFGKSFFSDQTNEIIEEYNDAAIVFENKNSKYESHVTFGPYLGETDLYRRQLKPISIEHLGDVNFKGLILEYRFSQTTQNITLEDFKKITEESDIVFDCIWSKLS